MTTKKTASKKTEAKNTAAKAARTATDKVYTVRDRAIGFQQRSLELQENAFDRTFDVLASLQERTEDRIASWLEKSERVPSEARKMVEEWIGFNQDARKGYKSAVNKSFDLGHKWFEGMKSA